MQAHLRHHMEPMLFLKNEETRNYSQDRDAHAPIHAEGGRSVSCKDRIRNVDIRESLGEVYIKDKMRENLRRWLGPRVQARRGQHGQGYPGA